MAKRYKRIVGPEGPRDFVPDGDRVFSNSRVIAASAWSQSGRFLMQDALSVRIGGGEGNDKVDYFGVFDGHGLNGNKIAKYAAYNLPFAVQAAREREKDFGKAIKLAFSALDASMRNSVPELRNKGGNKAGQITGGSTCCAVWIKSNKIYSANIGDSRLVLSRRGKAEQKTTDHKPTNPAEAARIKAAGGYISSNGRVNGMLGISRAFGDYVLKRKPENPIVVAVPDICEINVENSIDFIIVATDGLWDKMPNQEVVDYILYRMSEKTPLNHIVRDMLNRCKSGPADKVTGEGSDNLSAILIILR